MVEPEHEGGDDDHRPVVDGALLVAGGQPAPLLEPIDAALHHVAQPIPLFVEGEWAPGPMRPSFTLIGPLRNGVRDSALTQYAPTSLVAVAFVGDEMVWAFARPALATRAWDTNG